MVRGAREIRTPDLLVANETRYRSAIAPCDPPEWSYADLNCGPLPCHGSALPAELQPQGRPEPPGVGPGGLRQQFTAGLVRAYAIPARVVRLVLGVHTVELS